MASTSSPPPRVEELTVVVYEPGKGREEVGSTLQDAATPIPDVGVISTLKSEFSNMGNVVGDKESQDMINFSTQQLGMELTQKQRAYFTTASRALVISSTAPGSDLFNIYSALRKAFSSSDINRSVRDSIPSRFQGAPTWDQFAASTPSAMVQDLGRNLAFVLDTMNFARLALVKGSRESGIGDLVPSDVMDNPFAIALVEGGFREATNAAPTRIRLITQNFANTVNQLFSVLHDTTITENAEDGLQLDLLDEISKKMESMPIVASVNNLDAVSSGFFNPLLAGIQKALAPALQRVEAERQEILLLEGNTRSQSAMVPASQTNNALAVIQQRKEELAADPDLRVVPVYKRLMLAIGKVFTFANAKDAEASATTAKLQAAGTHLRSQAEQAMIAVRTQLQSAQEEAQSLRASAQTQIVQTSSANQQLALLQQQNVDLTQRLETMAITTVETLVPPSTSSRGVPSVLDAGEKAVAEMVKTSTVAAEIMKMQQDALAATSRNLKTNTEVQGIILKGVQATLATTAGQLEKCREEGLKLRTLTLTTVSDQTKIIGLSESIGRSSADATASRNELQLVRRELTASRTEFVTVNGRLQTRIDSLEGDLAKCRLDAVTAVAGSQKDFIDKTKVLLDDNRRVAKELDDCLKAKAKLEAENLTLRGKEVELVQLKRDQAARRKDKSDLEKDLKSANDALRKEVKRLQTEIGLLLGRLADAGEKLLRCKDDILLEKTKNSTLVIEKAQLQAEVTSLQAGSKRLAASDATTKNLQDEIGTLRNRVATLSAFEDLESTLSVAADNLERTMKLGGAGRM